MLETVTSRDLASEPAGAGDSETISLASEANTLVLRDRETDKRRSTRGRMCLWTKFHRVV